MNNEVTKEDKRPMPGSVQGSDFLTQLKNTTYVVHYRGRQKVEQISIIAASKDEAIQQSQKYCGDRNLRWMSVTPFFADITEEVRVSTE